MYICIRAQSFGLCCLNELINRTCTYVCACFYLILWGSWGRDGSGQHVVVVPLPSDGFRRERIGGHGTLEVSRIPLANRDPLRDGGDAALDRKMSKN
jgi:hypothetical protein